ncbi:MAG TPA: helix-turn-helix transcriptional regulator [Steroidobacteraceae bacterium]|jgi:transcriptional regulator with XRE-family HTH domain|nr:helix-turn-helix transcriptional regulator [Steroidobacteraceae bacterium]
MPQGKKNAKRPSSLDVVIGRNVRLWRMARELSQAQLASQIGITFQQLQKYEVGANRIPTSRLLKLAGILAVEISRLLDGTGATDREKFQKLALFEDRRAYRLAAAFNAIPIEHLRLRITEMVEVIAAVPMPQPQAKRRRKHD